ncbi:MAG TPA: hypothetical protein VET26_07000 [Candidatus Sulfotelmatobacter sp.]|nr:hypothetical protein [Candidatus Sulfotelmatobacter sp.]
MYQNYDVAWQRLKDLQLEMENSRLSGSGLERLLRGTRVLAARAWHLAGIAMQRPPRAAPFHLEGDRSRIVDTAA